MVVLGVSLYLAMGMAYVLCGRLNTDEGWYLQAAREVRDGRLPYRDFAYSQMPLAAYLHATGGVLSGPGLRSGRWTSFAMGAAAVVIWIAAARRRWGWEAAEVVALLAGTFAAGAYHHAIVKTYAPVSLLLALAFDAMAREGGRPLVRGVQAAFFAWAAAGTRLPAIGFAIPVALWAFRLQGGVRGRLVVLSACALPVLSASVPLLSDPPAALWHVLGQHGDTAAGGGTIRGILLHRVPGIVRAYPVHLFLAIGASCALRLSWRGAWGRNDPMAAYASGLALFTLATLPALPRIEEHLVPVLFALLPLLAGAYVSLSRGASFLRPLLAASAVVVPLSGGWGFLDRSGARTPLEEVSDAASRVRNLTARGDEILALEALVVAVEAERPVPPGLSMGPFSYQDVVDADAVRRHVVNRVGFLDLLRSRRPKAVLLTGQDWRLLERQGVSSVRAAEAGEVRAVLDEGYVEAFSMDAFGQFSTRLTGYVRRQGLR
ncbi:MAG: hypothetical protein HY608_11960 [Planctomycetes bacterium]|nr:hypothetical protein [Planctomycetota bacterium]